MIIKISIDNNIHLLFVFELNQNRWDLEDTEEHKEKIMAIANERYKGWRSTLSSTYKAYNNYAERMKHKPEDLDIVEWHYMVLYFGTESFKVWLHYLCFLVTHVNLML